MTTNAPRGTPAEPEPREETISRVAERAPQPDPSSRRRLGAKAMRWSHASAVAVGALVVLVTAAAGGPLALALALGGGVAIGAGVIAALLFAEREDGRIERIVRHERGGDDV